MLAAGYWGGELRVEHMKLEIRATVVALTIGLAAVGATYSLSALVAPRLEARPPVQDRSAGAHGASMPAAVPAAQLVTVGRRLYAQACASCHGDNAQGAYGPALRGITLSEARLATVIRDGVPPKMPAFARQYDAARQRALVAYVRSLET